MYKVSSRLHFDDFFVHLFFQTIQQPFSRYTFQPLLKFQLENSTEFRSNPNNSSFCIKLISITNAHKLLLLLSQRIKFKDFALCVWSVSLYFSLISISINEVKCLLIKSRLKHNKKQIRLSYKTIINLLNGVKKGYVLQLC